MLLFFTISSYANAQTSRKNILDLDPNIIAAANCNRMVFTGLKTTKETVFR
jgi:hypothetical protein